MGSKSDWETMSVAADILESLSVPYETQVVSAHRTPDLMVEYAKTAEAAHLPGMTASNTSLPVIGVPVESKALKGMDSLLSIVQMPGGCPVATCSIGKAGAKNAALLAVNMLGIKDKKYRDAYKEYKKNLADSVLKDKDLA